MSYRTIVADPPWRYNQTRSTMKRGGRGASAEAHYPTMTMPELAALPIADLVEDQAHLYLWVTNPRLYGDQKSRVISPVDIAEAWGFQYVTLLTWIKEGAPGPGWYFRGYTEHVLFCTRGGLGIPAASRLPNYFSAPKGNHSVKPGLLYDLVERVSPGPYLELFARRNRLGWDTFGDQALNHVALLGDER